MLKNQNLVRIIPNQLQQLPYTQAPKYLKEMKLNPMKPYQLIKALFKGDVFDMLFFFVDESNISSRTTKTNLDHGKV